MQGGTRPVHSFPYFPNGFVCGGSVRWTGWLAAQPGLGAVVGNVVGQSVPTPEACGKGIRLGWLIGQNRVPVSLAGAWARPNPILVQFRWEQSETWPGRRILLPVPVPGPVC